MNIGKRAEELINVQLNFKDGHRGFHLVEIARYAIDSLGHEFEDEIQIYFVFL